MTVNVEVLTQATDEAVRAFVRLLPQLSSSAPALDPQTLRAVLAHEANTVLIARLDGEIVGALTLVVFPIPTGLRAWIEDVVVDAEARGAGVGAALTNEAVRIAQVAGARSVDLTSRPTREAANRLYVRLGFAPRDSQLFRFTTPVEPDLPESGSQRPSTLTDSVGRADVSGPGELVEPA
jgi:ribosomal protein S18 acetylase RimI-like enzyme